MAGPAISIELNGAIDECALNSLHELLSGVSSSVEVRRRGDFVLQVVPESLGITMGDGVGDRPILVTVYGPTFGDEDIFDSEHEGEPAPERLIGFVPTHSIGVIAMSRSQVDHLAIAELAAAAMDIVGGVAMVELDAGQFELVQGLPGLRAAVEEPWATAYGSAEFVRSWAAHPAFRLLK